MAPQASLQQRPGALRHAGVRPSPSSLPLSLAPSLRARAALTIDSIPDARLADSLSYALGELCRPHATNALRFPDPADPAALFFSPFRQKSFTLAYYCRRLLEYNACSKSCFPVAVLYLVRLADRFPIFEVNDFNVHRLLCTAVMLAAKWLDDVTYSNAHYAKVGGIQTSAEMASLEEHFLRAMDYRLFVSKESFDQVESHFIHIALTVN